MEQIKLFDILPAVEITEAVSEGKSMARVNGVVVFIEGGVPGDVADVKVVFKKANYLEAKVEKIISPSPNRTTPFCNHFGTCGGCSWQHMHYDMQLHFKQKQVQDALVRVGKIELPEILPIIPSANTRYYRNRLDFTFSNKRWLTKEEIGTDVSGKQNVLGFHKPKHFDKVIDINECFLQDDLQNKIRNRVREIALRDALTFADLRQQQGLLRNLIFRSTSTGEWMVIFIFRYDEKEAREKLLGEIAKEFPQITSLIYIINDKHNDTYFDRHVFLFKGRMFIVEEMDGLKFKISPKSFFQTNSLQAHELYKVTRDFAALKPNETVYDLYTGTGTIALFVARQCAKVVGVDYVEDAIEDAKENARFNNISNATFFAGDMKKILTDDFVRANGKPDVIITDPPRAGMDAAVVNKILDIEPERIVYVSCNASTQARDLSLLDTKYKVEKVQPVDMFPQTAHVENMVLLVRK